LNTKLSISVLNANLTCQGLLFAVVIALLAFALAKQRWKTARMCLLGFHLHLVEDLLGSRGPDGEQWPIPYLAPFSSAVNLTWRGQWGSERVAKFCAHAGSVGMTLYLAWSRGYSFLELFYPRADREFVMTLRRRVPRQDA
jgi:hypothetical protein